MTKIKVTVNTVEHVNEIIDYWKDKDVNLEIKLKENTTAENSDVRSKIILSNNKIETSVGKTIITLTKKGTLIVT